jgi:hypothetical protein
MASTLTHQFQQSSAGMLIMFVGFQVFDKLIDSLGQQCHLHFGRAGVVFVEVVFLDDLLLLGST